MHAQSKVVMVRQMRQLRTAGRGCAPALRPS